MRKYKSQIKEANINFDFPELLKKLEMLTDRNLHGEARLEIAKAFRLEKFIKIFNLINSIHKIEGHMPYNLGKYRDAELLEEMLKIIEQHFGIEIVDDLNRYL